MVLRPDSSRVLPDRQVLSLNNEARTDRRSPRSQVRIDRLKARSQVHINNRGMRSRARIGRRRALSRVRTGRCRTPRRVRIGRRRTLDRARIGLRSQLMAKRDVQVSPCVLVSLGNLAVRVNPASLVVPSRRLPRKAARGALCFGLRLWS